MRFYAMVPLFFLTATVISYAQQPDTQMRLERVVIVQRHGVRAPTKPSAQLSQYSAQPWRQWPVQPGELTAHGADGAQAMGAYLKAYYGNKTGGNDDRYFVWSDAGDTRTVQSGQSVARALRTDAKEMHSDKNSDPIFSPEDSDLCPPQTADIRSALPLLAGTDRLAVAGADYDKARLGLAQILQPGINQAVCAGSQQGACLLINGENTVAGQGWNLKMQGPLATGSTLSENLLLEYAQDFSDPGWGHVTAERLSVIMPLHNIYADIMRKNPAIASHRAAILVQTIADALQGQQRNISTGPAIPASARFILFLGHDSNLSNLAGVYGLNWQLAGQPDNTAPNTALAFELWRTRSGQRFVRLHLFYQTLEQLRQTGTAARGRNIALRIPHCKSAGSDNCPVKTFLRLSSAHSGKTCLPSPVPHSRQ